MHESDVFIDSYEPSVNYLYDSEPIPESLLPQFITPKEAINELNLTLHPLQLPLPQVGLLTT